MGNSPMAMIHKLNRFKQRHCVRWALMNKKERISIPPLICFFFYTRNENTKQPQIIFALQCDLRCNCINVIQLFLAWAQHEMDVTGFYILFWYFFMLIISLFFWRIIFTISFKSRAFQHDGFNFSFICVCWMFCCVVITNSSRIHR